MKLSSHLDYFTISIDHIINNKLFLSLFIFVDYFFILTRIPALVNKNSFYLQISLCSYLSVIYDLDNIIILFSLSLSIFVMYLVFYIIKGFISEKLPKLFKYIYVNLFELILLRLGLIVFSDIHITFIAYLTRKNTLEYSILLIPLVACTLIYYYSIIRHMSVFYSHGYVTFNYPYDSFSKSVDIIITVIKVISPLSFTINEDSYCKKLIPGILLALMSLISFYSVFVMVYHSYFIIKNLVYNKIRIGVTFLFTTLGFVEWLLPIHDPPYFCIISFITIGLLFMTIMIRYNELTFTPLKNKNIIINLLYFHYNYDTIQERKMLINVCEKLQDHYSKCSNCGLCAEYAVIISKIKEKTQVKGHEHIQAQTLAQSNDNEFEKEEKNITLDYLIDLYKHLNKDNDDYFNILLTIIDKLSAQTNKKNLYAQNSNNGIDTSFNFRLKLFSFLRKQHNTNSTLLININYLFNKHFGTALASKSESHNNNAKPIGIELINDFISKFQIAFKSIRDFLNSALTVQTPKLIFHIGEYIEAIKAKKYKAILTNNHLQHQYYCLLISIVYEQFINTSLNKISQIIDEESLFEEIIETHYQNDRLITLKINLLTWDILIMQIGNELIEFLNKEFREIFPPEFRKEEMEIVKEKISKEDNRMLLVIKQMINYKRESKKELDQREEKEEGSYIKQFAFLELRLIRFSHCSVSNSVLAQGIYAINKSDLIVIKKSKDSPNIIYGVNSHSSNLSITNSVQLVDKYGFQFKSNPQVLFTLHYNTFQYDIGHLEAIETQKDKPVMQNLDDMHLSSMNNQYDHNYNWNFNCTLSMLSSMNASSSILSHSQSASLLYRISQADRAKKSNKKWIKRIFALLICFSILMILYSFITMFFEINMVNTLKTSYDVFTSFRHINRQYYHTIASIVSITCLGHLHSDECVNYMAEYNKKIKKKYNNDIDLISLIHKENVLKLRDLQVRNAKVEQNIFALNDPNASHQFELEFEYYQIILREKVMVPYASSISFRDGMKRLINSMSSILEDVSYTKVPIYLINVKPVNFENVYNQKNISNGQIEYYHIIVNYGNFLVRWFSIYDALNAQVHNRLLTLQNAVLTIMIGTLILHIALVVLISTLVNFYWTNAADSLNAIQRGKSNPLFLSAYIKKIELLGEMLLLYKENPNKVIRNIKQCCFQYQNNITKKKKKLDSSPSPSSSASNSISSSSLLLSSCDNSSIYIFSKKDLLFLFSRYTICLISLTLFYLSFFIFFYFFWTDSINDTYLSFDYINHHSRSEATAFSVFTLLQLMIYGNQTKTSISSLVHQEDPHYYINELHSAFNYFYTMEATQRKIQHLIYKLSDEFTLHCDDFYEKSKDNRFTTIIKESKGILLPQMAALCNELFPSMNMNDELIVYKDLSKSVYNIIYSLNDFAYEELEAFLRKDDLHYAELLTYLAFRPLRRLINELTYAKGIENIRNRLTNLLTSYALIIALTDILSIILLYFGLIMKLYKIEKKARRLKKVFNISSKQSSKHNKK